MYVVHLSRNNTLRGVRADVAKAYDSHCNLVLGEVEETIYVVEDDDDEQEEVKVKL